MPIADGLFRWTPFPEQAAGEQWGHPRGNSGERQCHLQGCQDRRQGVDDDPPGKAVLAAGLHGQFSCSEFAVLSQQDALPRYGAHRR